MTAESSTKNGVATEYGLTANVPLRLRHARGRKITCLSGTAWITVYGQSADFFLRAGQSFEVPDHGLTLIEPIGPERGRVRISPRSEPVAGWGNQLGWRVRDQWQATLAATMGTTSPGNTV